MPIYKIDKTHPIYWQVKKGLMAPSAFYAHAEAFNREHADDEQVGVDERGFPIFRKPSRC